MIDLIIEPDSTRIRVMDNFATKIFKKCLNKGIQTGKEQALHFFADNHF